RGLPPDDHVFPAGGAWRAADGADRDREQGRPRPLRRGGEGPRPARQGGRCRLFPRRALPHPAPPPGRNAGGSPASAALETGGAEESGGVGGTMAASDKTALLLIDIQQGMFGPEEICHEPERLLANAGSLLSRARAAGVPVFHVQHCEEEGAPL